MTTVLTLPARPDAPIACDMSTAPDTPDERLASYRTLFESALTGRERADGGVVLTFRADAREAVEQLAQREAACCPFLDYRVETAGDEVVWTIANPRAGDERAAADAVLDPFYALASRKPVGAGSAASGLSGRPAGGGSRL
jgi:hypothetical protein